MEHYFTKKPTSRLKIEEIEFSWQGFELKFKSPSGVFSVGHIDLGSLILLSNCVLPLKGRVLDLGCGYGFLGICIAKANPELHVTMTDVNERAIKFTRQNMKLNKTLNTDAFVSDLFEQIDNRFETIISNPPTHAGKETCMSLITQSYDYLKEGGTLQIVARHQKGGRSLMAHMKNVFGNVNTVKIKSGFRVYLSTHITTQQSHPSSERQA